MCEVIAGRHTGDNRYDLAQTLAASVASSLSRVVSERGHAVLAVSGGTTPVLFFDALSRRDITWPKVTVTLVDERQVDEDNPRSNARLVKQNLLRRRAAAATFVGLFRNTAKASGLTPDVVVLGMGEDGHTASFFPGGDRLTEALDPNSRCAISTMEAPNAGEARLTFTLSRLLAANHIYLHIEGKRKLSVLETAQLCGDVMQMPIRAVLKAAQPLQLYWCP